MKKLILIGFLILVNCLSGCGDDSTKNRPSVGRCLFYLIDYQTQLPVMCCQVPPDWIAGGKTIWSQNPAQPVTWYAWRMNPSQAIKMIVTSSAVIGMPGRIQQIPLLQNPQILANHFLSPIQKDYNLSNIKIVDAVFRDIKDAENSPLLAARRQQSARRGIAVTGCFFKEFIVRYEGERAGKTRTLILSIPVIALESRISMSYTLTVEFVSMVSFCCKAGDEKKAQQQVEEMVKSVQVNPNFIALINHISNQRTSSWISAQIEIRNRQMAAQQSVSSSQSPSPSVNDRVADMWSEHMRDVDSVANPNNGEKMFIDRRYDHAWINGDNEIIYHNTGFNTPNASTPTFDPNSNALFNNRNWQKLK